MFSSAANRGHLNYSQTTNITSRTLDNEGATVTDRRYNKDGLGDARRQAAIFVLFGREVDVTCADYVVHDFA
jgi:hypothetical protein